MKAAFQKIYLVHSETLWFVHTISGLINDLQDDSKWHSAIQYKVGEHKLKPVELDATWDINAVHVLKKETRTTLKHGATEMNGTEMPGLAVKVARPECTDKSSLPLGLIWDSKDYSCAYDSLFMVLYNIWTDAPRVWSDRFGNITVYLSMLSDNFQRIQDGSITIEAARDVVRQELNLLDPREYPFGAAFTCLAQLTSQMMANRDSGTISLRDIQETHCCTSVSISSSKTPVHCKMGATNKVTYLTL
jgi:hypothetical protein